MTIPIPPTKAWPIFSRCNPAKTSKPSPPAPMMAAITAIDKDSMIVWFSPAMIVGSASGIWILHEDLPICQPECACRLYVFIADLAYAQVRQAYHGRNGKDDRGDQSWNVAYPEEHDRRYQVNEGRGGLHDVENRAESLEKSIAARAQNAQGKPNKNGKDHGGQHQRQGKSQLDPYPHEAQGKKRDGTEETDPPRSCLPAQEQGRTDEDKGMDNSEQPLEAFHYRFDRGADVGAAEAAEGYCHIN